MSRTRNQNRADPTGKRRELLRLIRRMQALTLELKALRGQGDDCELRAKERALEQLRWRLAVVARRAALDGNGGAA